MVAGVGGASSGGVPAQRALKRKKKGWCKRHTEAINRAKAANDEEELKRLRYLRAGDNRKRKARKHTAKYPIIDEL